MALRLFGVLLESAVEVCCRTAEATIDALAQLIEIPGQDSNDSRKVMEESEEFQVDTHPHAPDRQGGGQLPLNRFAFPASMLKARLFLQYPLAGV